MAKAKLPAKSKRKVKDAASVKKAAVELKRLGVAFTKRDLRKPVSQHMARQVKRYEAILKGDAVPIFSDRRGVKYARESFQDEVQDYGRNFVVVKNEPGTVKTIRRDMLSTVRPLSDGTTIERLTVPGGDSVWNVLRFLERGGADKLKLDREWFSFRFQDYASARIFPDAKSLYEFLSRYVEEDEEGDGSPPKVQLYRIYPPNDWYYLVKREALEFRSDLTAESREMKGRELRRVKFAIERQTAKLKKIPAGVQPPRNERHAQFLERERERNRKRQRKTEARRAYMRDFMRAKRKAQKEES